MESKMQRSVSNVNRVKRYDNPNSQKRDLADAIEAELIGAKQHKRYSYSNDKLTVPTENSLGASFNPNQKKIIFQPTHRRPYQAQDNSADTVTSDESYQDEQPTLRQNRVQDRRQRSVSTDSSDDDSIEQEARHNSWSNKNRLMNGLVDYDMTETVDTMSISDEKQEPNQHRRYHHTNENMDTAAAVFHSSRANSKSGLDSDNGGEERREWMKDIQNPQSQPLNAQRQKVNLDQRQSQIPKKQPVFDDHIPTEYPLHNSGPYPDGHGHPPKARLAEKSTAQPRQPKTVTYDPQVPLDGRPPLPLDAKKLQQQQAAQRQQQQRKMQEKKRRFPIQDFQEPKKGSQVETVPETCRLHVLSWIENGTRRFLWHLARRLTSVPTLTVVIPLIVCALSTIGVIIRRDSLRMELPFRSYYLPENDQISFPTSSIGIQQIPVNDFFNASNPRYDAFQRTVDGNGAEYAVIMRTDDHNVLEEEAIESYMRLHKKIEEIKIVNGQKIFKYSSLCRRNQKDTCQKDVIETLMSSGKMVKFHYPETIVAAGSKSAQNTSTTFFIGNTFGGVETDQDGSLAKAESLAMYFKLRAPSKSEIKDATVTAGADILKAWDEEFQRILRDEELAHSRGKSGSISWWSYGAFVFEVITTFKQIYVYLAASLGIFGAGALLATLKASSRSSKPGLGLVAAIIIFLVVGGGWCVEIGITGYINPAIFPAFFFVAATALHFMINTLQSWRKYSNIAMDPAERIRVIMSWDSPCLLWTCLIICISYVVTAAVVNMAYFRSLSQFLAASSFLIIFLVLLFFVGAMYVAGKREAAGFKWFQCAKKVTAEFPPALIRRYHMRDVQLIQKKMRDEQPQVLRSLGEVAANVHARYVALLIFCIYLIFAAWGCSLVPIRISERQYIRTTTNLHQFLGDYGQFYGRYDNYLILTFHDSIDYFDNRVRTAIFDMLGWVETQEHVAERAVSWLKEFAEFEKTSIYLINRDTFVPVVDLIFLKDGSPYQRFAGDIAFGRYREQIIASRMYIELNSVGVQRQLEIVKTLTAKAQEAGLAMTIRTPTSFLIQHDIQLATTTITTIVVLIGILSLLSFIVFAQPYLTVLTILTVVSVAAGTIGFTALWDVPVNALNIGAVFAAIMHSAALCISCCHQYGNSGDITAVKRMAFTFQSWFPGAIWSSLIGLAAFSPLLFVDCQIVQDLAKLMLCHFLSILLHVTVFLPPSLVLFTTSLPTCCKLARRMCEESLCLCCSSDEDATSIYYIPTGGRPLDPIYVQQFYQLKFREDILPQGPAQPLPPPPVREMIMPPPPRGPPSSIGGSAANYIHRGHSEQRCMSPPPMLDSRMHSARSSMQRQAFANGPNPATKVYRYGANNSDFEEIMRARTARAAYNKRHMSMSPDITDPAHRSRRASPEVISPRIHRRSRTASPLAEPHQRHQPESEEIYNEPSDPESMSLQTANTNAEQSNDTSQAIPTIDSGDEDGLIRPDKHTHNKSLKPYDNRIVELDSNTNQNKPKITYAKWSKEIPLDPFTTERVTAEKYTIEGGDGTTIDLPPDWKRYWIKGNLRCQAGPNGMGPMPDMNGMMPPGDHHIPMHPHPHPQSMPMQNPGGGPRYRPPPGVFRHAPPADGPIMMPPYGGPPPLPPRPPFGLPRAPGAGAYRGQPQAFRHRGQPQTSAAWMY